MSTIFDVPLRADTQHYGGCTALFGGNGWAVAQVYTHESKPKGEPADAKPLGALYLALFAAAPTLVAKADALLTAMQTTTMSKERETAYFHALRIEVQRLKNLARFNHPDPSGILAKESAELAKTMAALPEHEPHCVSCFDMPGGCQCCRDEPPKVTEAMANAGVAALTDYGTGPVNSPATADTMATEPANVTETRALLGEVFGNTASTQEPTEAIKAMAPNVVQLQPATPPTPRPRRSGN